MKRYGKRGTPFWERMSKPAPDSCWEWTWARDARGYGNLTVHGRYTKAHRHAYELANGSTVPRGLVVMHRCDNPPCCNPAHLSVGTQSDNLRDMVAKDRNVAPARLHREDVAIIRARRLAGETLSSIAGDFGVTRSTIGYVVRGDTWRRA